ncbi:hypothetical protein [Streptomyces sp. SBT349]|uniref:hypothetical protein n=1 Tax=Streptomyces sp. SBT349 TaxID=1580539 RepID=UPI00066B42A1|nr:hypothetical protein [Streptomyces sp. SBT349]
MTASVRGRGRRATRTALAAGTVGLGLVALAGCQKPSPNAHFTLGSHSESRETADDCFAHGDGTLGVDRTQECLENAEDVPAFTTKVGDTFRVGVDPEVADSGWLLFYDGILYDTNPFGTTYQTFEIDELTRAVRQQNQQSQQSGQLPEPGELRLVVAQVGDGYDAEAIWSASSQEEYQERLFGSFEGVWNVDLTPES